MMVCGEETMRAIAAITAWFWPSTESGLTTRVPLPSVLRFYPAESVGQRLCLNITPPINAQPSHNLHLVRHPSATALFVAS